MDLTQQEWIEQLEEDKNAVILDVRTEDECNEGIIPNAIMIDINKGQGFVYQIEELDKSKTIMSTVVLEQEVQEPVKL